MSPHAVAGTASDSRTGNSTDNRNRPRLRAGHDVCDTGEALSKVVTGEEVCNRSLYPRLTDCTDGGTALGRGGAVGRVHRGKFMRASARVRQLSACCHPTAGRRWIRKPRKSPGRPAPPGVTGPSALPEGGDFDLDAHAGVPQ